jgi:hypothetical protein
VYYLIEPEYRIVENIPETGRSDKIGRKTWVIFVNVAERIIPPGQAIVWLVAGLSYHLENTPISIGWSSPGLA